MIRHLLQYLAAVFSGRIRRWNECQGKAFRTVYAQLEGAFPEPDSIHQAALLGADLVIDWFFSPVQGTQRKRAPQKESQYTHLYAMLVPGQAAFMLLGRKPDMARILNELSKGLPMCLEYVAKIGPTLQGMDLAMLRQQTFTPLDDILWQEFAKATGLPDYDILLRVQFQIAVRRSSTAAIKSLGLGPHEH